MTNNQLQTTSVTCNYHVEHCIAPRVGSLVTPCPTGIPMRSSCVPGCWRRCRCAVALDARLDMSCRSCRVSEQVMWWWRVCIQRMPAISLHGGNHDGTGARSRCRPDGRLQAPTMEQVRTHHHGESTLQCCWADGQDTVGESFAARRMAGCSVVTAKQCICAALVEGCQHIKRGARRRQAMYGDPGQQVKADGRAQARADGRAQARADGCTQVRADGCTQVTGRALGCRTCRFSPCSDRRETWQSCAVACCGERWVVCRFWASAAAADWASRCGRRRAGVKTNTRRGWRSSRLDKWDAGVWTCVGVGGWSRVPRVSAVRCELDGGAASWTVALRAGR
ncbi:uncharacterized protein M421DRAFT_155675 [Didymella exigua CBS 183.55]|uniref:Uncharacterized protein n=1 Tax=Didymella exigua CBS 183.55 TaxID=1150837 RepID=A0A6A5RMG6_9PLEO|nr:uncharacterized protein M421DRAFT_155675 [Didymella exigua CBS 183.55]KAF1928184.1 hypothetical protein M421DRAFT_155675 [Didymella exigua CBS 183.55]